MARNKIKTDLSAPVDDPGRAPYTPPQAKERRNGDNSDPNAEPQGEDRVYGVESRARWGGADSDALRQQHADARTIDEGGATGEQEEEEEEDSDANSLTVAELRAALDEAEVEYSASAKKAELVELYNEHIAE